MRIPEEKVEALRSHIQQILQVFKVENAIASDSPYATLNLSDLSVVAFLGDRGSCIMRDIAEYLGIALSTTTSIVDRLVRRGLVLRERVEEDRRIVRLALTKEGEALHYSTVREQMKHTHAMLAALDREEQDIFLQLVAKIALTAVQNKKFVEVSKTE